MRIKNQIKKILVLSAMLFLFLQVVVIFASSPKEGGAVENQKTQIFNDSTSQPAGIITGAEKQEKEVTFADLLKPTEVSEEEGIDVEKTATVEQIEVSDEESQEKEKESIVEEKVETQILSKYTIHKNIITTYFWAGEGASDDNGGISNVPSAWDEKWMKHFGGEDDPKKRNGYFPAKFTPKENPFYFALPYNDFGSDGERRSSASTVIPWAKSKKWKDLESMCKNQWIRIMKKGKSAYAQWEDVGPYETKDADYVFGGAKPKNKNGNSAGLDVSPAVRDYLGLSDVDMVDWQFIDESSVPSGPWKQIITRSQIYWE